MIIIFISTTIYILLPASACASHSIIVLLSVYKILVTQLIGGYCSTSWSMYFFFLLNKREFKNK